MGTLQQMTPKRQLYVKRLFLHSCEKLIGPWDETQPLHAHSRQNLDIPTTTSTTISQMETLGKDL